MNFGKRTPEPEARRIIDRAVERGIDLFDTSNAYGDGESERILGRAVRGRRDRVRIATKVGWARLASVPEGLSRARVLAAADESLARLATDRIDVYYLHVPDHATPPEETLGAVRDLLDTGKIRAWAVSNYASWQIEMIAIAERDGMPRPSMSQVIYNFLVRQIELEYLRFARKYSLHTTVYNPLAGGLLSGRHRLEGGPPKGSRFDANPLYQGRYWTERFFALVDEYAAVARDEGTSLVTLAYAWLAGREGVDSILIGPATIEHLDAAIDAVERPLSSETLARIDAIHRAFQGTEVSYAR